MVLIMKMIKTELEEPFYEKLLKAKHDKKDLTIESNGLKIVYDSSEDLFYLYKRISKLQTTVQTFLSAYTVACKFYTLTGLNPCEKHLLTTL